MKLGGVFVVARNNEHLKKIVNAFVRNGIKLKDIFEISSGNSIVLSDKTVEEGGHDYKIVITTMYHTAGYTLTRLKSMVTSVYPSNNASREQIEGRVARIGQTSKNIPIVTVHTGILTHIMLRHKDAMNLSAVLKKLADDI